MIGTMHAYVAGDAIGGNTFDCETYDNVHTVQTRALHTPIADCAVVAPIGPADIAQWMIVANKGARCAAEGRPDLSGLDRENLAMPGNCNFIQD